MLLCKFCQYKLFALSAKIFNKKHDLHLNPAEPVKITNNYVAVTTSF